jgi:hypothetical protein
MRALRAVFLFGIALALAWIAGWGMPHSELSAPAAMAGFACLALAVAPRSHAPSVSPHIEGKVKARDSRK